MDKRTDYTDGLRRLAQFLDDNPEVPLPHDGTNSDIMLFLHVGVYQTQDEARAILAKMARLMGGTARKKYDDDGNFGFSLSGSVGGVNCRVFAQRETVCTRVSKGTKTVEVVRVVKPAEHVTETREVEDFEWVCDGSILAPAEVTP